MNKTSQLNNLKTRAAINTKISVFVICVEAIICYYIICMTVPLIQLIQSINNFLEKLFANLLVARSISAINH